MKAIKGKMLSFGLAKAVLYVVIFLFVACTGNAERTADISSVKLEVPFERLDHTLFHSSPDSMASTSLRAYAEYGEFYRTYIEDILQGAPLGDPRLPTILTRFTLDPDWRSVQEAIDSVLGDMHHEQRVLEDAFKRLIVLFPDSLVPRIIVFNSGFNYGITPTDSVLGIGAEWFIGSHHPVVGYLAPDAFPQYVKDRMIPAMLVPSALKGWLLIHYTRDVEGADVLTNLVEVGKAMALLDALLPDTEARYKFAFTQEQLEWCEANELAIWKSIVERLFSKNSADIGRLMNDGPFTNGLPRESPGHLGEWIGYRMVQAYLKANPEVSFQQLFALDDAKTVLKNYKPN